MKHLSSVVGVLLATAALTLSNSLWAYDSALAESYANLFAPVQGAKAGKHLNLIKPEMFVNAVKAQKPIMVIDVRTPAEMNIVSSTLPGTLTIPINELFKEKNLRTIPVDRKVVILCKSGARATAAGTALRHLGFKNVYILKGGLKGLIGYLGPKEANSPPKQAAKK